MKRPAIFFDRDNTLIASDGYLGNPGEVRLLDGAPEAVARARALGYATVIFSNQSGVARGMFDEQAVHAVNDKLDELLHDQNPLAVIDRHEFCPFHPEGTVEAYQQESDLRKPKPGMIYRAAEKLALDVERSWVVGDAPRDIEAGHAAGCRTILFRDPRLPPSPAAREQVVIQPDYVVGTLKEALSIIERATQQELAPVEEAPEPSAPARDEAIVLPVVSTPGVSAPGVSAPPAGPHLVRDIGPAEAKAPASPPPVATPSEPSPSQIELATTIGHLETLSRQILAEIRRAQEQPEAAFSVSKLLAGIVQILVLAALFYAYLQRGEADLPSVLIFALVLQTMTIALLIMGRQH